MTINLYISFVLKIAKQKKINFNYLIYLFALLLFTLLILKELKSKICCFFSYIDFFVKSCVFKSYAYDNQNKISYSIRI